MGSGSSTNVKTLDKDETKSVHSHNRKEHTHSARRKSVETGVGDADVTDESSSIEKDDILQKLADLKIKLAETASEKCDVQDQLQSLEERLDEQVRRSESGSVRRCSQTLLAKDQYISKLAAELAASQLLVTNLKARHKKKLRTLNSQLTEVKQGASIQIYELNDKISRLEEEKQMLKMKVVAASEGGEACPDLDLTPGHPSGISGHMSLILDLSQQVSEQHDQITKLEAKLTEKNKQIKQLRSSAASLEIHETSENQDGIPDANSPAQRGSKFMSSGWHHANNDRKVKVKFGRSDLTPVEDGLKRNKNEMNASRDSGIGSAGKVKSSGDGSKSAKRIGSGSSGMSELTMSVSDSDSDWGSGAEITPPNKVQSAPPGLRSPHLLPPCGESGEDNWSGGSQNVSVKGKPKRKKKLHLRMRADQRNSQGGLDVCRSELLKPTLAFIEQT